MSRKENNTHDLNTDEFDYIILGTNLTENVLGAGLACSGSKCLYIDKSSRYGGNLSNFNLEHLFKYSAEKKKLEHSKTESSNNDGYHSFRILKKMERSRFPTVK
jgi:RAB protein geranylgeranyltransferase component A